MTTRRLPGDQAVRTQLLEDLDSTFVVEAAAGTGKTTVLVERIVMLVRKGRAKLSELISVTFTEKAAGEMKLRLRTRLERAREEATAPVEQAHLTLALEELEVARIGTIHGLCADLLREYPVEAGVDPLFEVAVEEDSDALLSAAFHRHFQDLLQAQPDGVRRALRRRPRGFDAEPPRKALFGAVRALVEHRDFDAPWRREPFEREPAIDALLERFKAFVTLLPKMKVRQGKRGEFLEVFDLVRRLLDDVAHRESVSTRDYDGLEAQLKGLTGGFKWTSKTFDITFFGGLTEPVAVAERDSVFAQLKHFVRAADADLAARLHQELRPVVEAYELEKARKGVVDFVDLLLLTRNLLQQHQSVRQSLQGRFHRLFVDEFQDTDPLQSEIVLLLAADDPAVSAPFSTRPVPGKLFVVGDPKQSIYRFRRADILLYERVKRHLTGCGAQVVYLSTSFRSTPGIQAAVNAAFAPKMTGQHQATYVPLGDWREANREQPSVIALPAPRPSKNGRTVTKDAVESSLPEAIAGFIDWLVHHSRWTVDEEGQRVPLQARHVCILFKRMRNWNTDLSRRYAQALEARRVPHVLVGGRSFHQREEVRALRTALFAVDRPDDEFSVYATLRGPFFAFTDEQLFVFKHEHGKLHPLRPWEGVALPEPAQEVVAALEILRTLHLGRNRRPVSATVHELLERTRAHAGVAFWTAGAQSLANVLQLAEVSRRHERRASSFRDVVESLEEEALDGEAAEAPLVEEGTEGVRMMTVHAAKGLEFPVVILAEPTANAARQEPSHWVDPERGLWVHALAGCVPVELREREAEVLERDREETLRLTYVAATRARDVLVVPVCSEKQFKDTWTEVLYPALYPQRGFEQEPRPAPGCPPFGRDPVLGRETSVPPEVPLPGLHRASTLKNGVVWWDTNALDLGREERAGLEAADALLDDDLEGPKSLAAFAQWQERRALAIADGQRPSARVTVARELPPLVGLGSIPVEQTDVPRAGRAGGRRFGELVHACLAVVPLDASAPEVARAAAVMARSLQAPPSEEQAAVQAVLAALCHPRVAAARRAKDVRREVALVDHLADGTVVEGAIDLAYELDGSWQVVEFKTDESIDAHLPQYEAQAQAYVRAIAAATGKPARGVILRV